PPGPTAPRRSVSYAPLPPSALAPGSAYTAPRQTLIIRGDGGGTVMAMPSSRVPPESGSMHVWSQLDVHRKQQAISVVAQMAFNVEKPNAERSPEEKNHAARSHPDKAPHRALAPSRARLRAPVAPHPGPRQHGQCRPPVPAGEACPSPGMARASRGGH